VRLDILDQLGRRVEAHRLAVEQRGRERRGVMALQPRRHVSQKREAGGVRFGKAVLAEAFDLVVNLVGELLVEPARNQAVAELVLKLLDDPLAFPRSHRPPKLIRLARRESRRNDRQSHHLLLKERHAERLRQNLLDDRIGIRDRLLPRAPPQEGMHHAPLNRSRPHDRHLDD
jgi:hypothetical protein